MSSPSSSGDIYEETLSVFDRIGHPSEPLTTPEIAAALDRPRRTIYKRLVNLVDRNELETKKVGSSARVWWRSAAVSVDGPSATPPSDPGDRTRIEDELHETKTRYRRLVEQNLVGIYIIQDEEIKHVNPKFADVLGYTPDEMIGRSVLDLVAEEDRGTVVRNLDKRERDEVDDIRYEIRGKHRDGSLVDVEVHGGLIEYDGEPAILGMMVDMTDWKRRERELEESELRYRTLANHFPNGAVALYDHDLRYSLVAGSEFDDFDLSSGDVEGRRVGEAAPDTSGRLEEHCRAALGGEKRSFEIERDGGVRQVWTLPVRDEQGSVIAGMIMTQDITERVERERDLERYRRIVEAVGDAIYVVDEDQRFTMVNRTAEKLTGYPREQIVGSAVAEFIGEKAAVRARELGEDLSMEDQEIASAEFTLTTADRRKVPLDVRFARLPTPDGSVERVGIARDISQRKARERELHEQRERYRHLVEASPAPIAVYTADGTLAYVNDAAVDRIAADSASDLLGESAIEFVHPDDRAEALERMRRVIEDREPVPPKDTRLNDVSGQLKHTIITAAPIVHEGKPAAQVVINDITERKQLEVDLKEAVDRLERSNDRLRQFAYAASHDLQEPLRMISSYLQLLEHRYENDLDSEALEFVDIAVDSADRMRQMIDDLLAYSRLENSDRPFEPVDCDIVLERVLTDLQIQIEECGADIVAESLPTVVADDNQLEQLFKNIVSNALKYRDDDPPRVEIDAERRDGRWQFRVADNGIGIDPDHADRIFEVFKRLHGDEEYSGTGIGLSLCQKIVEHHNGDIWVESEPGEGSTFYFTLPIEMSTRARAAR